MLKNMLRGMLIGLANIIPGVSGGTLAVSMGIYDTLIHCVTHIFSEFKKSVLFLLPIILGAGIAIIGSAFGIDYLFESFPWQTNLLFCGLILGSLPPLWQSLRGESVTKGHLLTAIVFFVTVIGFALLNGQEGTIVVLKPSVSTAITLFFIGVIAAATMVIPGVSGSMMLLLMGFYHPIINSIQRFIVAAVNFDFAGAFAECYILIPFGIGVVIGIFVIAKLIELLFAHFRTYAYWGIIGLILASPVAILLVAALPALTIIELFTGLITLGIGFLIAMKLS